MEEYGRGDWGEYQELDGEIVGGIGMKRKWKLGGNLEENLKKNLVQKGEQNGE